MTRTLTATVSETGVLRLEVPMDPDDANKTVRVTVESLSDSARAPMDQDAWRRFIEETAGSIPDPTFMRHPQGEYEDRENLP